MEARAIARYVRVSPRKARLVGDLIRGKGVEEAMGILSLTRKAVAGTVTKVLKSAIANAENTKKMDVDNLYVKRVYVDQGPTMKRIHARAMGKANVIRKRMSHITVILDEK
ncbi:MAG: 50S ribosomal protein L22 [Deltaproteobacteria bacterium]|nr:50S ribosomal protein L22 [Deltaproteobacteria bacterium]